MTNTNTQLITAQDARDLIEGYNYWKNYDAFRDTSIDQFFREESGKTLLDKLNEHREPEVSAESLQLCAEQGHRDYFFRTGVICSCKKHPIKPKLYLHPLVTANKAEVPDEIPVHVLDTLSEVLGDAVDCSRTWSAWRYGTMGESDFHPVADSSERVDEIARAVLKAYFAPTTPLKDGANE